MRLQREVVLQEGGRGGKVEICDSLHYFWSSHDAAISGLVLGRYKHPLSRSPRRRRPHLAWNLCRSPLQKSWDQFSVNLQRNVSNHPRSYKYSNFIGVWFATFYRSDYVWYFCLSVAFGPYLNSTLYLTANGFIGQKWRNESVIQQPRHWHLWLAHCCSFISTSCFLFVLSHSRKPCSRIWMWFSSTSTYSIEYVVSMQRRGDPTKKRCYYDATKRTCRSTTIAFHSHFKPCSLHPVYLKYLVC